LSRPITLTNVVLLSCVYNVRPPDDAGTSADGDGASSNEIEDAAVGTTPDTGSSDEPELNDDQTLLELEGLQLTYEGFDDVDVNEFVLFVEARLTQDKAPYDFEVVMGARFDKPEPPVNIEAAKATLLFMMYPYLRETISNITNRSPYGGFLVPPLAKLPHPQVTGEETPEGEPEPGLD
jgi:hypothetical protein